MDKKKNSSSVQSTELTPQEIQPTLLEPTPTEAAPIVPKPVSETTIRATDIRPASVEATPVTPKDIVPTAVSSGTGQELHAMPGSQPTNAGVTTLKTQPKVGLFLSIAMVTSILFLVSYLLTGFSYYLLFFGLLFIVDIVAVQKELKKITVTPEEIDAWNAQLKQKGNPNLLKPEDFKKSGNRLSFWLHSQKSAGKKLLSVLTVVVSVACIATTPVLYAAGIGGEKVAGNSYEYGSYVFTFEDDDTYIETYEGSVFDSGTYAQSGSKVTCHSHGGITIIFTVGFGSIESADGVTWQKR